METISDQGQGTDGVTCEKPQLERALKFESIYGYSPMMSSTRKNMTSMNNSSDILADREIFIVKATICIRSGLEVVEVRSKGRARDQHARLCTASRHEPGKV